MTAPSNHRRRPAVLARLSLLAALASTFFTLVLRAKMGEFAIMAALSWLGGGLLLYEREEEGSSLAPGVVPATMFWPGLVLLIWVLLVLSFSGRLYDSLFYLVPLATLCGLALVGGATWQSILFRKLAMIGALLPAQGVLNATLPTGALQHATANLATQILWVLGRPAVAEGTLIQLSDRILDVNRGCAGLRELMLCLAAAVLLWLVFPLPTSGSPSHRRNQRLGAVVLLALSLCGVFLINTARIALLAYTDQEIPDGSLAMIRSFTFWHDGAGAQMFSLLAMGLVVAVYFASLESALGRLRRVDSAGRS